MLKLHYIDTKETLGTCEIAERRRAELKQYEIGAEYKYFSGRSRFKLKEVVMDIYVFECGHRVTGNVFEGMINCRTGLVTYQITPIQLQLQF